MKYLKKFENDKIDIDLKTFSKDYIENDKTFSNDKFEKIYTDLEELKKLKIDYTLYYVQNDYFGLLFKIFIKCYLTDYDIKRLKSLGFYLRDLDYTFTFNWIKTDEKYIDEIIVSHKYNL